MSCFSPSWLTTRHKQSKSENPKILKDSTQSNTLQRKAVLAGILKFKLYQLRFYKIKFNFNSILENTKIRLAVTPPTLKEKKKKEKSCAKKKEKTTSNNKSKIRVFLSHLSAFYSKCG